MTTVVRWLLAAMLMCGPAAVCGAQEFPSRPVKMVVGFGPGGLGERLLASDSAGNAGKVPVPGGDAALAKLSAATTPSALTTALRQADVVYQQQLPIIPLYFSPYVSAWTGKLIGGKKAFAVNGEADLTALGVSG